MITVRDPLRSALILSEAGSNKRSTITSDVTGSSEGVLIHFTPKDPGSLPPQSSSRDPASAITVAPIDFFCKEKRRPERIPDIHQFDFNSCSETAAMEK